MRSNLIFLLFDFKGDKEKSNLLHKKSVNRLHNNCYNSIYLI